LGTKFSTPMTTIYVMVPVSDVVILDQIARKRYLTRSDVVRYAIKEYIEKNQPGRRKK